MFDLEINFELGVDFDHQQGIIRLADYSFRNLKSQPMIESDLNQKCPKVHGPFWEKYPVRVLEGYV